MVVLVYGVVQVVIAMDVAASEFYSGEDKTYDLNFKYAETEGSQKLSGRDLASFYTDLIDHFPIVSVEVRLRA